MAQYKTPGVYVKEINSFGSSIVASPTAVPVFIGFTEKMTNEKGDTLPLMPGSDNVYAPVMVRSVLEYSQSFGEAEQLGTIAVVTKGEGDQAYYSSTIEKEGNPYTRGFVQPAIANFFANGGGSCYIISLGQYSTFSVADVDLVDMDTIKLAINMAEESTLILPTDLIRYEEANYYNFCNGFIKYCSDSLKQFCVLDVVMSDPTDPVLNEEDPENYRTSIGTENLKFAGTYYPYLKSLTPYVYEPDLSNVTLDGEALSTEPADPGVKVESVANDASGEGSEIDNGTIESVKTYLASNYINMPASPFMAGIYSRLDNATGVWTPPANVAPTGISGPVVNLTSQQQENFNGNAKTGKSINAIRNFTGKGTLVWGARTNDGNSLDWRYINVKRLFIAMETDISMALEAYVFKPNVFNTWVEVKTMIDSYLFGLYNDGAFAGQTVETSYQVLIGVGETMTEEDLLNGLMKVSIQVAPVRSAEFIELTFSQLVAQ